MAVETVDPTTDTQPDRYVGVANFMSSIGDLDTGAPAASPAKTEDKPDGPPTKAPDGNGNPDVGSTSTDATKSPAPDPKVAGSVPPAKTDGKKEPADAKKEAADASPPDAAKPLETDEKWPRTAQDWDKFKTKHRKVEEGLRAELGTTAAKVAELETALTQAKEASTKAPAGHDEEVATLKKTIQELHEKFMETEVTADPKFVAHWDNQVNAQISLAQKIVGPEQADALAKALKLPDTEEYKDIKEGRIQAILDILPDYQRIRIGAIANKIAEIGLDREGDIARAGEHKASAQAKRESDQRLAATMREKTWNDVVKAVQDPEKGSPLFQERPDNPAWNQGLKERIETARRMLTGEKMEPAQVVQAALNAASMPAILEAYKNDMASARSTVAKLEAQVKELQAATPTKGGSAPVDGSGSDLGRPTVKAGMSPLEASQAWARSMTDAVRAAGG